MQMESHLFSSRFMRHDCCSLLSCLCLEVDSAFTTLGPSLDAEWHEWKTKHGKTYNMVSNKEIPIDDRPSFAFLCICVLWPYHRF